MRIVGLWGAISVEKRKKAGWPLTLRGCGSVDKQWINTKIQWVWGINGRDWARGGYSHGEELDVLCPDVC